MKRAVYLFLILAILFTTTIVVAQNSTDVDKSYACLKKQLGDNCGNTQSTSQASFNLLAMAYDGSIQSDCTTSINNKKKTDCWPETSASTVCNLKSTALAIIALKYTNANVDDSVNWLLSKKKLATDLTWYLEIDANNATECTVNGQKINIGDNKKITGTDPSGLQKAYNNYWFEIKDIKKNYTVSCNKDFITALIYKKPDSSIYYISGETHSAPASDSTTESVNGYCFSVSDKCDYEGSLWTTLALSNSGEDISPYIPYSTAMSDESSNAKYLPLAFLYMLHNSDDYLSQLLGLQKQNKYWDVSGDKLYDTAIALLALQSTSVTEAENAKDYLMTLRISSGENAGCWLSNTALILHSAWPKTSTTTGPVTRALCTENNYHCVSRGECQLNATLDNFYCSALSDICCETEPAQLTCEQKDGFICKSDEECSVNTVPAADTSYCCVGGACQKTNIPNECEDAGYLCKTECSEDQEEKIAYSSSCNIDEKCCANKSKVSPNWWLIILLIILIILVILAIIFRNQLKIWWFKIKSGFKSKKGPQPVNRPSTPPPYPPARPSIMPRQIIPRPQPVQRAPPRLSPQAKRAERDKEFEDTMKRLRDMSK